MQIFLANPRGFCAGVERAINILKKTLKIYGPPIYVHHEIVHNKYVIDYFKKKGVIFIEKISHVPKNAILIFSAHGVSEKIKKEASFKKLFLIFDATCPLVSKVHSEVKRASRNNIETILIGHANHPEVQGTLGQYNCKKKIYLVENIKDAWKVKIKNVNKVCFVTQTTLSIFDTLDIINILYKRFPKIIGPHKNNICYATINRQKAVQYLSKKVDMILVVGSKNSSNANRLLELANRLTSKKSFLINSEKDIKFSWLKKITSIGITSGASTPEFLVKNVVKKLLTFFGNQSSPIEIMKENVENVFFKIPKKLL